jgi:magnesium chelatase family protein
MLIAAMNPCPCGFHGDRGRVCRCSPGQIERYAGRISGPLLDRIDLVIDVPAGGALVRHAYEEPSAAIRDRVGAARRRQRERCRRLNADLEGVELRSHAALPQDAASLLDSALQRFRLSARACDRVLRVSRTIADLAGSTHLETEHVAEAIQYRVPIPSPDLRDQ